VHGRRSASIVVEKSPCPLCRIIYSHQGVIVLSHTLWSQGRTIADVVAMSAESLHRLVDRLHRFEGSYRILSVEAQGVRPLLSGLQALVLRYAVEMGYYDIPRHATLDDIAERLGMSRSAVADALRRAEAKVVKEFVRRRAPLFSGGDVGYVGDEGGAEVE
jgi:predicted DNA binding protein